jgi:hypothetical protein
MGWTDLSLDLMGTGTEVQSVAHLVGYNEELSIYGSVGILLNYTETLYTKKKTKKGKENRSYLLRKNSEKAWSLTAVHRDFLSLAHMEGPEWTYQNGTPDETEVPIVW